jgi:hypothetical protein
VVIEPAAMKVPVWALAVTGMEKELKRRQEKRREQ